MNESQRLAEYVSQLSYPDLPTDVVKTAKMCILDIVGVGIGASRREWTDIVDRILASEPGDDAASLWGRPGKHSARNAALLNGTAAHGIEMDDRMPVASVHPGCYAVSAGVAAAEKAGATGQELITAVVAGYELGLRIGMAMRTRRGLHKSGHKGVWLATAAAGRGMSLNTLQIENALGLAGSMASGVFQFSQDSERTMVKRLHGGFAAHNGVLAAELAREGFDGPREILEGRYGYCQTFGEGDPELGQLTRDLGNRYLILAREVKPYSSWGGAHGAIDAVRIILASHELTPTEIGSVRIGGSRRLIDGHEMTHPSSIMAAQYSLPFVTAVALTHGPDSLIDPNKIWTAGTLEDDTVRRIVSVTSLELHPDLEARSIERRTYGGARVTVRTLGGQEYEAVVEDSKGTVDNPMSEAEIEKKFRLLTREVLSKERADRIVECVNSLHELEEVGILGAALRSA